MPRTFRLGVTGKRKVAVMADAQGRLPHRIRTTSAKWGLPWAEKMKTIGVDLTANIGLQPDVHNKGFVIDSEIAVVSSQNFSPAGAQTNRDAGVILEHAGIAKYFETVFIADWQKAKPAVAVPAAPAGGKGKKRKGAGAKAPAKRGTTRKAKAKGRRSAR
jgi:phosphatidylserine/phosphatidylglycerophosphate/cardiolipin synthase-like enzyme